MVTNLNNTNRQGTPTPSPKYNTGGGGGVGTRGKPRVTVTAPTLQQPSQISGSQVVPNYQTKTGQQQQVTYVRGSPQISFPTSGKSGVVDTLASRGAFGTPAYSNQVGYSGSSVQPTTDPLAGRPQYSSSYGYSTSNGRAEVFFPQPKTQYEINQDKAVQLQADRTKTVGEFNTFVKAAAFSTGAPGIGYFAQNRLAEQFNAPRYANIMEQPIGKLKQRSDFAIAQTVQDRSLYKNPLPEKSLSVKNVPYNIASGFLDYPNDVARNPIGSSFSLLKEGAIGAGLGAVGGSVITGVAGRSLVGAKATEIGITGLGAGVLGFQAVTQPVNFGRNIVNTAVGTGAFVGAYRETIGRPTIKFDAKSFTRTSARGVETNDASFTSYKSRSVQGMTARITEFGSTREVPVSARLNLKGTSAYNPLQRGYDVSGRVNYALPKMRGSAFSEKSGSLPVIGATSATNTRSTVALSIGGDTLNFGSLTKTTKGNAFTEGLTLTKNPKGIFEVTESSFSSENVNQVRYGRPRVVENRVLQGDVGFFSRTQGTNFRRGATSGEARLFEEGFGLLKTRGITPNERPTTKLNLFGRSKRLNSGVGIPETRRASISQPTSDTVFNPSSESVGRGIPSYGSFSVGNVRARSNPAIFSGSLGFAGSEARSLAGARSTVFSPSKGTGLSQSNFPSVTNTFSGALSPSLAKSDVNSITQPMVGTDFSSVFIPSSAGSGSGFTPFPAVTPPLSPPPTPVLGGGFSIPGFGYGGSGGGREGRGSRRGYQYAPSVNAILFNIKSSRRPSKNALTGFEVRPIIVNKRSKR